MPLLYKEYEVTGVANDTVFDTGLTSTEAEKKRVVSLLVNVSGQAGNYVKANIEREEKISVPDYLIDTDEAAGTNQYKSIQKINELPVGEDIPIGQTFKVGIKCGGTAKNLRGSYVYELI